MGHAGEVRRENLRDDVMVVDEAQHRPQVVGDLRGIEAFQLVEQLAIGPGVVVVQRLEQGGHCDVSFVDVSNVSNLFTF
ncbi:MAG: hypothetical protein QM702_10440 [Rubrivivax sp.]